MRYVCALISVVSIDMACPSDYSGFQKIKELRDHCDNTITDLTVKDMSEMTFEELRMLFKYADLLHDHCDGDRTTILNCAKNRYHLIPDELKSLFSGATAAGTIVSSEAVQLIQFLNAIHNGDKHLNTTHIEDSFSELLSYAFPREFGGTTLIIADDLPEIKNKKAGETKRRANQLSNIYNTTDETAPTITVDDIAAGNYNIVGLQDYNTLQISLDHHTTPAILTSVGNFIRAYFATQNNGSPDTTYNVVCDSSPNIVKFMKSASGSPFTQIYTAQTVLDSASSGRTLLSDAPVPMYVGDDSGIEHTYTTYGLTNATSGINRLNRVAKIKTRAVKEGGAEKIIITTTLTNIGAPIDIIETLYVSGGGDSATGTQVSTGPTLPYIAELNDQLSNGLNRGNRNPIQLIENAISGACTKCNKTMWNMKTTLTQFVSIYIERRITREKLKADILDYINDWKGFGDAEMVQVAQLYPQSAGIKTMFITGDRVSKMFGRFAGLPTAMSNTKHEHIMYRPMIQQTAGGRVLSELKLILDRLQSYNCIIKNYLANGPYVQHLAALKDFTNVDNPENVFHTMTHVPAYVAHPLKAKLRDLHVYLVDILTSITTMNQPENFGAVPIISSLTPSTQIVFDLQLTPVLEAYRLFNETQVNRANIFPISRILLTKYGELIKDQAIIEIINSILSTKQYPVTFTNPGKRKRSATTDTIVHMITLPLLVELLKIYIEQVAKIVPEFVTVESKIRQIMRLQIMQRGDATVSYGAFMNKLNTLKTKIHNGSTFELNAALRVGPDEFAQIVLEYDMLFKDPIKPDTLNNRHPFIAALRALGKSFFVKSQRDIYEDFIMGTFTTFLKANITTAITAAGGRIGRDMNNHLYGMFNTFVNNAFSSAVFTEPVNITAGGASMSPGGSRDQKREFLLFMTVLIDEFYDNSVMRVMDDATEIESINIHIDDINYEPMVPSLDEALPPIRAEPMRNEGDMADDLDAYMTYVIERTGFSRESFIFIEDLKELCKTVFLTPNSKEDEKAPLASVIRPASVIGPAGATPEANSYTIMADAQGASPEVSQESYNNGTPPESDANRFNVSRLGQKRKRNMIYNPQSPSAKRPRFSTSNGYGQIGGIKTRRAKRLPTR